MHCFRNEAKVTRAATLIGICGWALIANENTKYIKYDRHMTDTHTKEEGVVCNCGWEFVILSEREEINQVWTKSAQYHIRVYRSTLIMIKFMLTANLFGNFFIPIVRKSERSRFGKMENHHSSYGTTIPS